MIVYGYDQEGFYTGTVHCQKDPMRPGQFLIPSRATQVAPPEVSEGQVARFLNGSWEIVADEKYLIEQQEIVDKSLNEYFVPTKQLVNGKAIDRPLEEIQADVNGVVCARMRAERNRRIKAVEWLKQRHSDELALNLTTTLTAEQYQALIEYIQALREVPQVTQDPFNPTWPEKPDFV